MFFKIKTNTLFTRGILEIEKVALLNKLFSNVGLKWRNLFKKNRVYLFEDRVFLPVSVPVPPPDAEEDDAHADGHDAGEEDQLDPVDHVEGVHVD